MNHRDILPISEYCQVDQKYTKLFDENIIDMLGKFTLLEHQLYAYIVYKLKETVKQTNRGEYSIGYIDFDKKEFAKLTSNNGDISKGLAKLTKLGYIAVKESTNSYWINPYRVFRGNQVLYVEEEGGTFEVIEDDKERYDLYTKYSKITSNLPNGDTSGLPDNDTA